MLMNLHVDTSLDLCDFVQERASAKSNKSRAAEGQEGRPHRKKGQQKQAGCPFLSGGPNAEAWADEAVLQPMDVEVGFGA